MACVGNLHGLPLPTVRCTPVHMLIGTCQAMETLKLITGVGETLTGFVLYFDGKRMEWRRLRLPKDPNCPVCSG